MGGRKASPDTVSYESIHPVRNPRFVSFRTQPLENLSAAVKLPIKKRFLGNPTLGTNLGQRILAMRTGCSPDTVSYESIAGTSVLNLASKNDRKLCRAHVYCTLKKQNTAVHKGNT